MKFFPSLASLALVLPAIAHAEQTYVTPVVGRGASTAFDEALQMLARSMDTFYQSGAFQGIALTVLTICAMIGITWKARGLMWGEEEVGPFFWWLIFRVIVAGSCFFVVSRHLAHDLTAGMNAVTELISSSWGADKELPPRVRAKIQSLYMDQDQWHRAVQERLGQKIGGVLNDNETMKQWFRSHSVPDKDVRRTFVGTQNFGFPIINYGEPGVSYNTTSKVFSSAKPAVPSLGYKDEFKLYADSTAATNPSAPSEVKVRPLIDALIAAGDRLVQSGTTFNSTTPAKEIDAWEQDASGACSIYEATTALAKSAYLRDYAAWRLRITDVDKAVDDLGGTAPAINPAFTYNPYGGGMAYVPPPAATPQSALSLLLNNLQEDMDAIKEKQANPYGKILGALIPLALAIVGFYCTVTIWGLPICMLIWAAFFLLPKELEMSGALKKGMGTIIILFFIPVFSMLVVDVANAFVAGVTKATTEGVMGGVSAAVTGMAAAAVMPSGGIATMIAKAGVALGAGAASAISDVNIFVIAAWVVAFLFIIATPRIVSGIVFGTGGFAETLMQKITVGGGFGTAVGVMAMRGLSPGAQESQMLGGAVSGAGRAVGKGVKGIGGLGKHVS